MHLANSLYFCIFWNTVHSDEPTFCFSRYKNMVKFCSKTKGTKNLNKAAGALPSWVITKWQWWTAAVSTHGGTKQSNHVWGKPKRAVNCVITLESFQMEKTTTLKLRYFYQIYWQLITYINTYLSLSVYFPKKIRGQVKVFHLRYFLNYRSMFCICANECLGPFLHVQNLKP